MNRMAALVNSSWPMALLITGCSAFFAWFWRLLAPIQVGDRIAFVNLVVLVLTAIAVVWYSWETRQLRRATVRQTLLQVRPFLSLRYGQEDRKLWIHNIGRGVAREVRVDGVSLARTPDADHIVTIEWEPIDFIAEGDQRELIGTGQIVTREGKQALTDRLRPWMSNFGRHGEARYEFIIDYRDLTGQPYRAAFEVFRGGTILLRDDPVGHEEGASMATIYARKIAETGNS